MAILILICLWFCVRDWRLFRREQSVRVGILYYTYTLPLAFNYRGIIS